MHVQIKSRSRSFLISLEISFGEISLRSRSFLISLEISFEISLRSRSFLISLEISLEISFEISQEILDIYQEYEEMVLIRHHEDLARTHPKATLQWEEWCKPIQSLPPPTTAGNRRISGPMVKTPNEDRLAMVFQKISSNHRHKRIRWCPMPVGCCSVQ